MPYRPTGKPAGRPPKDPAARAAKEAQKAAEDAAKAEVPAEPERHAFSAGEGARAPSYEPLTFGICTKCYPEGWPGNASGLACPHGIWTRRL